MRQVAVWLVVGVVLTACGIEGEQLFGDAAAGGSDAATTASASGRTAVAATTGQGGASTENGVGGAFTVSTAAALVTTYNSTTVASAWSSFGINTSKSSSSIYTQVEEERHTHIQNANQVAPAALARAGVFTTGMEASKFWIDNDERAR